MALGTVLDVPCEVCGSDRVGLMRRSELHQFDVGRCRSCKMVWAIDPPPEEELHAAYAGDPTPYTEWQRGDDELRLGVLDHLRELVAAPGRTPTLFDVGAGVGDFLVLAREHGFEVGGNELSDDVIDFTFERHGIRLSGDMLADQPSASVDVVTMWCVLAHVPDPRAFLQEALAMLRPGGVLFLRTPRWCTFDTVAVAAAKLSRERLPQVADRRVTPAHLHLYNEKSLTRLLAEVGFTGIEMNAECHYPLTTDVYVESTLRGGKAVRLAASAIDRLIERDLFIRNALIVYARRPA